MDCINKTSDKDNVEDKLIESTDSESLDSRNVITNQPKTTDGFSRSERICAITCVTCGILAFLASNIFSFFTFPYAIDCLEGPAGCIECLSCTHVSCNALADCSILLAPILGSR
jgi:hypothetical protein